MDEHYLKRELYDLFGKGSSLFDFLQAGSLDGVWYWNLEQPRDEWMSPKFWEVLGYDPAEKKHLSSEWQDLIFPEDLQTASENFEKHCADASYPYDQIVRYRRKNGSTAWVRCRGFAIRDATGKPVRMLGVHTDITSIKAAKEDYQNLFREMLDGFALHEIILDETGTPIDYRFLAVNPAFERMTGLKAGDIVGRTVLDVLPGTESHWIETYGKVALTGDPVHFENYSAEIAKHFEVTAFRPAEGRFVAVFQDITERKRVEEQFRLQAHIIENSPVIAAYHDKDLNMVWANKAYQKATGLSLEDIRGRKCYQVWNLSKPCRGCPVITALETGEKAAYELTPDNQDHWPESQGCWLSEASPVRDERGAIIGAIEFAINTTESKNAEKEKARLLDQLQQAQKLESIGRLAGGVGHDFNNMLSIILGYGEALMQELRPGDPLRDDVKQIVEAGNRSAALTRQLLAFSRKQTLQPEVLNLNHSLRNLEKMLRRLIGEDIDLQMALAEDLAKVLIDPGQFDQIIMNLAVNARDAMPGGGRLTIETANVDIDELYAKIHRGVLPGKYVMISVTDSGCGMDKSLLAHLFEPFFTTKEKGKGTGLGLATVYGIVKQSGGNIWAYSEPGKGSTFKIYLPQTQEKPQEQEISRKPEEDGIGAGRRVLVVEDEEALRGLLRTILSRLGFEVFLAANGGEALLLVEEQGLKPDLLITDVVMPGMSGAALVERLRRRQPDLKVLFMSGYTDNAIVHHSVLDSGTPFIQKPFSLQGMAEKIRQVLKKG